MSTTTQGIDARGYLMGWLQGLVGMFSADINAIPEDKWNATFGGCTKPASDLTADAVSLLVWTAEALKGNVMGGGEGNAEVTAECATKQGAIARLQSSSHELATAFTAASDDTLNGVVAAPWGMEAPLYMITQIALSHIWYHDGQLNYIQCLLGDDKIHWMGG